MAETLHHPRNPIGMFQFPRKYQKKVMAEKFPWKPFTPANIKLGGCKVPRNFMFAPLHTPPSPPGPRPLLQAHRIALGPAGRGAPVGLRRLPALEAQGLVVAPALALVGEDL